MKQFLFGNPHANFINLRFDAVTPAEACITVDAILKAGWFRASLPLCLTPDHLDEFLSQLSDLDRTLTGSAVLKSTGLNGPITISLNALPQGHINCGVEAELDGNILKCRFRSDQTYLGPLREWWQKVQAKYQAKLSDQ